MQQEKLHRKRAYSQKVLKEALLKLLVDQPLSKITVQKLCETADVNRTTFYSNFEDIFALYRQVQDDFSNRWHCLPNSRNLMRTTVPDLRYLSFSLWKYGLLPCTDPSFGRCISRASVRTAIRCQSHFDARKLRCIWSGLFWLSLYVPRLRNHRNHPEMVPRWAKDSLWTDCWLCDPIFGCTPLLMEGGS